MAVSKELLTRYKEMKAKGIQITLTELKAQMEAENKNSENNSGSNPSNSYESHDNLNTASNSTNSESYNINENQSNSAQTISTDNYSANVNTTTINNIKNEQNEIHNNISQSSNWTTTYSSLNEQTYSNYSNSFNANYSKTMQPTLNPETYSKPIQQTHIPSNINSSITNNNNIQVSEPLKQQSVNGENQLIPDSIAAPTRKFALIGYPLGHSLSTYIHDAGFKSMGLKASYEILETPPDTLVDRIKYLKNHNYHGFNVTIPLKLPITMFLDEVDSSADIVNAINTVTINPDTKELKGYNTDVTGFNNAIPEDFTLCGKIAGILGTGGAARAAITALAQNQIKEIKLFTRNVPNSLELVNYLRKTFPNVEFNTYQIERIRNLSDINILVNTTPIGMLGRAADMTPVEENELRTLPPDALVYDVIYNPKKTLLLKLAQKYNYRTVNGVDMFIHQALAAEQIWTGRTPDFKDMKIAALENL